RRTERAHLLSALALRARESNARRDALLVHVQPTSTLDNALHGALPPRDAGAGRSDRDHEFARRARSNNAGCRMLPRHVFVGLFVPLGFDVVRPAAQAEDTRLSSREGGSLPMTGFRGHPMVGAEGSVHDAEEPSGVPAGVPAADDRVGPAWPNARGARARV